LFFCYLLKHTESEKGRVTLFYVWALAREFFSQRSQPKGTRIWERIEFFLRENREKREKMDVVCFLLLVKR
jgi:hypothetical protein